MAISKRSTSKAPALSVLRLMTKLMSTMTAEELEALASGNARLTIIHKSGIKSPISSDINTSPAVDLEQLKSQLSVAETTDAGFSILNEAKLTRIELGKVARSLDLPVLKQDSVRRLEEKIIEALIGSRLNSRAVRGR